MIRNWESRDNEEISLLEKECFSDAWSYDAIVSTQKMPSFLGLVCEQNGGISGYLGVSQVLDEADIMLIAVKTTKRRQGIAKRLLVKMQEILTEKGVKRIFLEVRKSNVPAIKCYENFGFSAIFERKRYYADGEDAIIMEKEI